jgi:glycine/D-amino acid oxidase-like deaminating enzyme/nitrite reductase/ring-hydroxylating ferredoxin subunit
MADFQSGSSKMTERPESLWIDSIQAKDFPKLTEDIEVDAVIVGGGIAGITTAYLLVKEGFKVALLEAGRLLQGTTGHTTAKITAQHGLIYDELIQHIGEKRAKEYFESNSQALRWIQSEVEANHIDCEFTKQDAFVFTNHEDYIEKIKKEGEAYKKLGIEGECLRELPFGMDIKLAISMKNQAQFHPLKYLNYFIECMKEKGALIYENTVATEVDNGERCSVITREGPRVHAKYVCACSHFPFYDGLGFYPARMYAERSYLIAIKPKRELADGMYITAGEPTRSLRNASLNGEKVILVGGENHKTGQGITTLRHYEALEKYAEETFGIEKYLYRWSAQDLTTLDKVPYVGRITSSHPNVFVATGFRKWGMTNGTAAAILLKDLIAKGESLYEELYSPSRFEGDPMVKNFLAGNAEVAKHLVKGKIEKPNKNPEELKHDEGAVVSVRGKRAGAYKDSSGLLHIVDTTCTHLGCEVEWNSGDRTWDCPCHGSRFSYNGEVVEGPAEKPLKRLE